VHKVRILVVEDETRVSMDIAQTLRNLGYEIMATVTSGEGAIEAVKKDSPDLILMDIGLKGAMDGIQAAVQIRSDFNIPVIYIITNADDETLERAKVTVPCGYITKPFQEKDLRFAIQVGLYQVRLESERNALVNKLQNEINKRIEFTSMVAHELKNSLTSLMAASELLSQQLQDKPGGTLAVNIYRSTRQMYNRVREMLDMARIEMGLLRIKPALVKPRELLEKLSEDIKPLASSRKQSVKLDMPQSLPEIWADSDRLWQIVANLLDNGSKFTPEGGTITIGAVEQAPNLLIFVRDTGKGMSQEKVSHLFDRDYRLEGEEQRSSGLGLGLALCKNLVEAHGGRIWVESREGEGSTFYFTIPLVSSQTQSEL